MDSTALQGPRKHTLERRFVIGADEATQKSGADQHGAICCTEIPHEAAQPLLDCRLADAKPGRELLVSEPEREESQQLPVLVSRACL